MQRSARIVRVGGDEKDHRILETVFRGAGHREVRFLDPAAAIRAIAAHEADVLLLDLVLPSSEVFAVLRAAAIGQDQADRIPVIVTGPATAHDRIQATLQRGAEDFLLTPFDQSNALLVTRRIDLCLHRKALNEFAARTRTAGGDPNETAVIELYGAASGKFVPRDFLRELGHNTVTSVRLGDHVQREMTVLVSGIRDFGMFSEQLTPRETFEFLNSYLRQITPVIRAHHGFIEKCAGDTIVALFPREPGDALTAAVELQRHIRKYNDGRKAAGYAAIRTGAGVHYGELVLGTVGDEERMRTTVVGGAVMVASHLEALTKMLGTDILVSKTVVENLPLRHARELRHLGAVRAKGAASNVDVYECFDNDADDLREHKIRSADLFARGVEEFRRGLFLSAGKSFTRVAVREPADTVAAYFRDNCSTSILRSREPAWHDYRMLEAK